MATPYSSSGAYTGQNGELVILTKGAAPIYFFTNDSERGRVTPAGFLKATNNGTYLDVTATWHEFRSDAGSAPVISISSSHPTAPNGVTLYFTGGAPNNNSNVFFNAVDNITTRGQLNSNGGLANYSANNVNLSDATVKGAVEPYDEKQLDALEYSFRQVAWCRFKYLDQSHDDWNHGYVAQNIADAFAVTAPELVDETEIGAKGDGTKRKGVYDCDLTHIAMALLARALKRIEALEAKAGLS